MKKCEFGKRQVKYLGHVVGSGELQVDQSKVEPVRDWPAPTCVKELQQFLGFANYYHRFIRRFADIALPLSSLL